MNKETARRQLLLAIILLSVISFTGFLLYTFIMGAAKPNPGEHANRDVAFYFAFLGFAAWVLAWGASKWRRRIKQGLEADNTSPYQTSAI